jgi:hypothetical protein
MLLIVYYRLSTSQIGMMARYEQQNQGPTEPLVVRYGLQSSGLKFF